MLNFVDKNNKEDILELENSFPQLFNDKRIEEDFKLNPFTKYLVYKLDNKIIVGVLNYTLIYDRIEIVNINVLEEYRRQKIASTLMEKLIENASNSGIINITLEVNINNTSAINLYEKYGFKKRAIRKGYYNGIDALLMEKELM